MLQRFWIVPDWSETGPIECLHLGLFEGIHLQLKLETK